MEKHRFELRRQDYDNEDPDEHFLCTVLLRSDFVAHKEPLSDPKCKDIIANRISVKYPDVLLFIYRGS